MQQMARDVLLATHLHLESEVGLMGCSAIPLAFIPVVCISGSYSLVMLEISFFIL
jgi:hypothetical protein